MNLPLDNMSVAEKIQLMEAIWDDLCRNDTDIPSPDWHGQVLEERQARIDSGDATFSDWEDAKRRIRDRTS